MILKIVTTVISAMITLSIANAQDTSGQETAVPENWYQETPELIAGMSLDEYQNWLETSGQIDAFEKLARKGTFKVRSEQQLIKYGATPEIIALLKQTFGEELKIPGNIWWEKCEDWYSPSGWCFCVDVKDKWDHECSSTNVVPLNL